MEEGQAGEEQKQAEGCIERFGGKIKGDRIEAEQNGGDNAQHYTPLEDGSLLAQGFSPPEFDGVFTAETDLPEIRSFRLEALTDPNLPAGGPGRGKHGLFDPYKEQIARYLKLGLDLAAILKYAIIQDRDAGRHLEFRGEPQPGIAGRCTGQRRRCGARGRNGRGR